MATHMELYEVFNKIISFLKKLFLKEKSQYYLSSIWTIYPSVANQKNMFVI